jgi:hypothetical protein
MNNRNKGFLIFAVAAVFSLFTFFQFSSHEEKNVKLEKVKSSSSPKVSFKMKKGRDDYFFKMLRDPVKNEIPRAIRQKELEFARNLAGKNTLAKKSSLNWVEAGPNNVGGRTRALAVDINNPNTIIAGGAGGGIWKSTDNGNS